MKKSIILLIGIVCIMKLGYSQELPDFPMKANYENSIQKRWDNKKVLQSKKLNGMESLKRWKHEGFGELSNSEDRYYDGQRSLKITSPTKGEEPGPIKGRPFGAASAIYKVDKEDWSDWNRISFWVYPDLPGFRTVSLSLVFHNDGEEKVPGPYDRNGLNYVILDNQEWNKVNWEIAHLGREEVTGVELRYRLQGNEPLATDTVEYYFDELELQKVKPDYYEGWEVAPGRISYSHLGYANEFEKTALASNLDADEFSIIEAKDGSEVLTKKIQKRQTPLGEFQIMDFTEVDKQGEYKIVAGDNTTNTLRIDEFEDIYRSTIVKSNNLFYTLRCGTEVPGIHEVCHRDAFSKHGDLKVPVKGGWHDAGDLSQSATNTAEATYSLLLSAQELQHSDPKLANSLIEEAQWGVEWLLKTRFGDGYRADWTTIDFWTDGILGNVDDILSEAGNRPFDNFKAAKAEAKAYQLIKNKDPLKAKQALEAAEEDWEFAQREIDEHNINVVASGLNTSLLLYEITDKEKYREAALSYGNYIMDCQQKENLVSDSYTKGFFYKTEEQNNILHYDHIGQEQAPVVGLVKLSEKFPDNNKRTKWEKSLEQYKQFYKTISKFTAPYNMLPAGIYDLEKAEDETEKTQIKNGIQLNDRYYIKKFPVWKTFRGNNGTILSQARGLAKIGDYFEDQETKELAYNQLQWVIGRNPFSQSLMYGAGYDFAPQYSAVCGDIVGGLPVGIQTHFNRDKPYYPTENCYNWKEIWVHPSTRWLGIMPSFFK